MFEFFGGEFEMTTVGPGFVEGFEVDVGMGDIGADDFPEGAAAGFGLEVLAEFFGGVQEGLVVVIREIVDFVDLVFGDDEGVALGFRVDIKEGESFVIFVDFVTGDFAVDDFGENGWFKGGLVLF